MITHDYDTNAGNPAYTSLQQRSTHVITLNAATAADTAANREVRERA